MEDALAPLPQIRLRQHVRRVLILVVMEDALAQELAEQNNLEIVLILVVMEDALAQEFKLFRDAKKFGLNPCCNGRCTRT